MPNYSSSATRAILPGDEVTLFDGETVTAPQASIAVAMAYKEASGVPTVSVSIGFASSPTDVVAVQTANEDVDSAYVTVANAESTNTENDIFQTQIAAPFMRLMVVSQSAGGAITATVRRAA